ncbi:MAG: hypothetical protein VX000_18560, partial [Myxococcota bacterium]|nr:hypothetical protein [Myxococcota bacterium]
MSKPRPPLLTDARRLRWSGALLAWGLVGAPALALAGQLSAGRPVDAGGLLCVVLAQAGLVLASRREIGRRNLGRV